MESLSVADFLATDPQALVERLAFADQQRFSRNQGQQLLAWAEGGAKPSPASMAAACDANCRLVGAFEPLPLERRVPARQRP